jgi:lipoprotein-releasing system permease protein
MGFETFIAGRYLRSKRKQHFISLNTYFSIGGVAIGVAALVIVLSVMNGFEQEVRARIVGTDAHLHVLTFGNQGIAQYQALAETLAHQPHIVGVSPFIYWKSMVASQEHTDGIVIKGIDPLTADSVADIARNLLAGDCTLDSAAGADGKRYPAIVLGFNLADQLRVRMGDDLVLMSPRGVSMSSLWSAPKLGKFVVTGLFQTGMYEYDATLAYISIPAAQRLFDMPGRVTGLALKTDNEFGVEKIGRDLREQLGYPYYTMSWIERNHSLFRWMTIEKWMMFIVLSLIVLVAAFNIISTLIMVVMEKAGEIGILKSMGATARSIMHIFMLQGLMVGGMGTLLGSLTGFVLCWVQQTYQLIALPPDIYFISALPVKMQVVDFAFVIGAAFVLCLVATIYPARKAAQLDPIDIIRYQG